MSSLTFSSSTISPTAILEQLQSIVTHLQCPVCLSIMDDAHIIPDCGHRFCGNCIKSSLRLCKNECPSCRTPVATKRRLRCDDIFDNLVSMCGVCDVRKCIHGICCFRNNSQSLSILTYMIDSKIIRYH